MKRMLLSLLFLSSMPLFSKDATANAQASSSAAADRKSRAADASSNAAALLVEADVKRRAPEVGVKLSAIAQQIEEASRALHNKLMDKVVSVALAGPAWQGINTELRGYFNQPDHFVPSDITNIMLDYAQSDIRPVRAILADITSDEADAEMKAAAEPLAACYYQHGDLIARSEHDTLNFVEKHEGVIFGHSAEILDRWNAAGFLGRYPNTLNIDRVYCAECGGGRDPVNSLGSVLTYFDWRNPLSYHRFGCCVQRGIRKAVRAFKNKLKQPLNTPQNRMPIQRTESQAFAHHMMNLIDVAARCLVTNPCEFGAEDRIKQRYLQLLNILGEGLTRTPRALQFAQDPQAWVEAENKRAVEHGSPIRYKLPKKPATK